MENYSLNSEKSYTLSKVHPITEIYSDFSVLYNSDQVMQVMSQALEMRFFFGSSFFFSSPRRSHKKLKFFLKSHILELIQLSNFYQNCLCFPFTKVMNTLCEWVIYFVARLQKQIFELFSHTFLVRKMLSQKTKKSFPVLNHYQYL